ncbi:MAG: sigma-54 interaction domain-containing protein [Candidatus Cryptobacteroides sp.]
MEEQELQRLKNKYDIIGNDPSLNRALEMSVSIAPTDLTVLIIGESGVGKDVLPRIIHQNSLRKNGKYFAVNCGAIPEGTIDSELFGHEKGSFTGATETRKGYFEEANGGTLFLDEVGELPLASQAKLLRVLQSGEFIKVGSSKVEKTDVRVIAATNVNLLHAVSQRKFREDLFYRLNAILINMPSLRDRKDDIYLLFRKFTSDFSEKYGMQKISLSHNAIEMLREYRWPGNIRQLKNVTETITAIESRKINSSSSKIELTAKELYPYIPKEETTLLPIISEDGSTGENISAGDKQMFIKAILELKQDVEKLKSYVYSGNNVHSYLPQSNKRDTHESLEAEWQESEEPVNTVERGEAIIDKNENKEENLSLQKAGIDLMRKALEKNGGNRKLAAAELGISERTLYRRLSENNENKK